MSPEDFAFVADLVRTEAGVVLTSDKVFFLDTRLGPLARREKEAGVDALIARLRSQPTASRIQAVVEAALVPETRFFRNRSAFQTLIDLSLPELVKRRGDKGVRILSAGCSSGQEAYSLAILVQEALPQTPTEIVAIDYSRRSLEKARAGLFSHFEVQRGLPIRRLLDNFEKVDENWRASAALRGKILWTEANLLSDLSGLGQFDVILCRYVLNSFATGIAAACLEQLEGRLAADGLLMLGVDEGLILPASFKPESASGLYRRNVAFVREVKMA